MYTYGSVLKLVATPLFIYFERMFHNKPSSYWGTPPNFRKSPYIYMISILSTINIYNVYKISVIEENLHC